MSSSRTPPTSAILFTGKRIHAAGGFLLSEPYGGMHILHTSSHIIHALKRMKTVLAYEFYVGGVGYDMAICATIVDSVFAGCVCVCVCLRAWELHSFVIWCCRRQNRLIHFVGAGFQSSDSQIRRLGDGFTMDACKCERMQTFAIKPRWIDDGIFWNGMST